MLSFQEYNKTIEVADIPKKPDKDDVHWGYHLIMDCSGANKNIDKVAKVKEFLKELVVKLKMKAVGEPIVLRMDNEKGRGVSGIQLITTSTITFHGDDTKWCMYLDVFSCKAYEPKTVFDLVKEYFEPKHIGHQFIYRDAGVYPKKKS